MRRYRVESKSKNSHFKADCFEDKLEYWKIICKYDAKYEGGECYYRKFPLNKSKKIYY